MSEFRAERPVLFWYIASYVVYVAFMFLVPDTDSSVGAGLATIGLLVYLPLAALTFLLLVPFVFVWVMLGVEDGWIAILAAGVFFGWLFLVGWKLGEKLRLPRGPVDHHHAGVYHRHYGAHVEHVHPDPYSYDYIPTNRQEN